MAGRADGLEHVTQRERVSLQKRPRQVGAAVVAVEPNHPARASAFHSRRPPGERGHP